MAIKTELQSDGLALYNDANERTLLRPNSSAPNVVLSLPTSSGTLARTADITGSITSYTPIDQTSGTSTVSEDAYLSTPVEANSVYIGTVCFDWDDGAGTSGFKYGFGGPTDSYLHTTDYGAINISGGAPIANSTSATASVCLTFRLVVGSTAGTFSFMWAQRSLDAGQPTTLKAGAGWTLTKVS